MVFCWEFFKMGKNVLFNFIDLYITESHTAIPSCQSLKKDTNKLGCEYYRFELNHNRRVELQDEHYIYTLKNHHVSVYSTESLANPFLSQYHYTAYFKDQNGTDYQLHVYLNDKNEMTTEPVFSIWQNDDFKPIANEQLHEHFINLACTYAKPIVKNLREQLSATVKKLEAEYKIIEANATQLSTSINDNYEQYTACLRELVAITKQITPLLRNNYYQNASRFIQQLLTEVSDGYEHQKNQFSILSQERELPALLDDDEPSDEKITFSVQKNRSQTTHKKLMTQQSAQKQYIKQPDASYFDNTVLQITTEFNKLANANDEECAKKLGDLLARINALSLTLEHVSIHSLTNLQSLHQKIHKKGEALFPNLLLRGKFESAKLLPSFYYLLDNYLELSLQLRNHKLLDFILSHGEVNINNMEVTVKGQIYSSPVHSCLGCDSLKMPMSDCLSVLIKHGASMFGSDHSGLPIAHTILSNHLPLKKAFYAHRETTIASIQFYKQLISILNIYLANNQTPQIPETTFNEVTAAIKRYEDAIVEIKHAVTPSNLSEKRLLSMLNNFADKHITSVLERVQEDPDVIDLKKKLLVADKRYLDNLSLKQRRTCAKSISNYVDNLDKLIDHFNIKFVDFDEVKKNTIEYLKHYLSLSEKRLELLKLQTRIRKFMLIPGKPAPKGYNTALVQQKNLITEITAMEQKYILADIDKVKDNQALLNSLNSLSNRLDQSMDAFASMNEILSLLESSLPDIKIGDEGSSNVNTPHNLFTQLQCSPEVNCSTVDKHEENTPLSDSASGTPPETSTERPDPF